MDIYANIISANSIGDVQLRSHIKNYQKEINRLYSSSELIITVENPFTVRYEWKNNLALVVDILSGKIIKISALINYAGVLDGIIRIGMTAAELLIANENIFYSGADELFLFRNQPDISIDIDRVDPRPEELINSKVVGISIFAEELISLPLI